MPAERVGGIDRPRRRLLATGLLLAVGGCGRGDRIEATVHWQGAEFAFGSGLALFDPVAIVATVVFLQVPPSPALRAAAAAGGVRAAAAADGQPAVLLELHLRQAGAAGFASLERYTVRVLGIGSAPLVVERRHADWVQDGGIELAGEAAPGGRLLGRLRRSGVDPAGGASPAWRWDLGFDAILGAESTR